MAFLKSVLLPLGALLLLAGAFVAGVAYERGWGSEDGAKEAIQQVLKAQETAWNKGDLEGFMVGYWNSPDLTFSSGKETRRGWQTTLERFRERYQAEGKEMGKLTFSDHETELLGPDTALVRGRWKVETSKETLGGVFTLLVKKMPEGWRIVHDHTSG